MELGGVPEKMDEYFHWGPIFYVCSSARDWIFSIYKVYNTGYTIARLHLATSLALSAFHNFEEAQQGYLHSYTSKLGSWESSSFVFKNTIFREKKHFAVNTFWFSVMFKDMRCGCLSNLQFWGVSLHQTYSKFTYQECNFDVNLHAQV